uniref:SCP domain-containing protein n=1 Tax=Ascaris lumbricoides TaxID=6252 RepID=A0A0M3IX14_ASCLU
LQLTEWASYFQCRLRVAPSFEAYDWPCQEVGIGIPGQHQYWNVTLAMQLSKAWLERMHAAGLELCTAMNKGILELGVHHRLLRGSLTAAPHTYGGFSGTESPRASSCGGGY